MQANEIRPCDLCGKGLCEEQHITFNRVLFQRLAVDLKAVRERASLALLLGGQLPLELVEVFATTTDIAHLIHEPADLLVCESCAALRSSVIGELAEIAHDKLEARNAEQSPPAAPAPQEDPCPSE